MSNKKMSVFIVSLFLFSLISSVQASSEDQTIVAQFGTDFNEFIIADSTDDLFDPRDLEFHPGRANELWIANRGDDSITIVHNTGLNNQTSENRQDSNHNHFLEEVSAIAFGSYHPEFDWQWGSAQETQNTYCGLGSPNQFMGPTLWPSSLSHYAVENQNNGNGLLGSHIDMNHESPDGMGIAHDNGNAYWYFDGYYGELVYYDFQMDHDTGQDDHSDGIVHRYSDVKLTRDAGIPGHMILDKDNGMLYIADTGANRVLWVNTDDTTINTQDIMNDPSRLEPLAEYKRMTGIEWGVIDTGLSRPSGVALDGDTLFISENGNGKITAYALSEDGKSAEIEDTIQTNAVFIMGLEIGPDGKLYYVDNGRDQVVRIDPIFDIDADGVMDDDDNCPYVANSAQSNYDGDLFGDACDEDDDNDIISDDYDHCPQGIIGWTSSTTNDFDSDGCLDNSEDDDDDNDGVTDFVDSCFLGELNWFSNSITDYDGDGCRDLGEDLDDDNDGICDDLSQGTSCSISQSDSDLCPFSSLGFESSTSTDNDMDGCEDATEDTDDDNDGFQDLLDDCPLTAGSSSNEVLGCLDRDDDGYADILDKFPDEETQWYDSDNDGFGDELSGFQGDYCIEIRGTSFEDRFGCLDSDGDGWSDSDSFWISGSDAFPFDATQHSDRDGDGYGDNEVGFKADSCPDKFGKSRFDVYGCLDSDGDGWSDENDSFVEDETQWADSDGDGYGDEILGYLPDSCPEVFGTSTVQRYGCVDSDGDGLDDELDKFPNDRNETLDTDGDGVGDNSDAYPQDATRSEIESKQKESSNLIQYAGLTLVILILLLFVGVFAKGRKKSNDIPSFEIGHLNNGVELHQEPQAASEMLGYQNTLAPTQGPPLPPEGLPHGWTMEQWIWYGEDYLKKR